MSRCHQGQDRALRGPRGWRTEGYRGTSGHLSSDRSNWRSRFFRGLFEGSMTLLCAVDRGAFSPPTVIIAIKSLARECPTSAASPRPASAYSSSSAKRLHAESWPPLGRRRSCGGCRKTPSNPGPTSVGCFHPTQTSRPRAVGFSTSTRACGKADLIEEYLIELLTRGTIIGLRAESLSRAPAR
jgi:hypothetical protein